MAKWIWRTALFACFLLSALWLSTATAGSENSENCPDFGSLDKNRDGAISRDEGFADEKVSKYWDQLDTDINSSLTQAEFSKLEQVVQREEALRTDHPVSVQQYENGKYISPEEQMERNKEERKSQP